MQAVVAPPGLVRPASPSLPRALAGAGVAALPAPAIPVAPAAQVLYLMPPPATAATAAAALTVTPALQPRQPAPAQADELTDSQDLDDNGNEVRRNRAGTHSARVCLRRWFQGITCPECIGWWHLNETGLSTLLHFA